MFCKECGTENLDTEVQCKKCNFVINSNLALNGTERVMVISFFVGLVASIFFGIIPLIICLVILFIIKKDKSMKILENGKKIFLGYLVILGIILSISSFTVSLQTSEYADYGYKKYLETKGRELNREERLNALLSGTLDSDQSQKLKLESKLFFLIGLVAVPLGGYIIYFLSNLLFFNILRRHEQWIIDNGLFADSKNEQSLIEKRTEQIQSIKVEPVNTADELLKWSELKEKGLISEDEFQKAKEKILDGKLL